MKRIFGLTILALLLASCSDKYLTRYYSGGTLFEDQYVEQDNTIDGSLIGIYSKLYEYGSGHDEFGQRSIDMYCDFMCGDMAMSSASYGWFQTDELGLSYSYRKSYIWGYYYDMIRLSNLIINALDQKGVPELVDGKTQGDYTETEIENGYYYGEALAIRGFCYAGLQRFFCKTVDQIDLASELSVIIYTEDDIANNNTAGNPRSTAAEVYNRAEQDLSNAVEYMSFFEGDVVSRSSKLRMDQDVARAQLAYLYLNKGEYENALKYAKQVIDRGKYTILPQSRLLTSGFGDVNEESWMWGENVTIDNSTGLASFFGQVDIYTYSYAWAGDAKCIDAKLRAAIPTWDGRQHWFDEKGRPIRKFYSVNYKDVTAASDLDRDWLNDNVFMRIESVYLIAAEAAAQQTTPDLEASKNYLKAILDQRVDTSATAQTEYADYLNTLSDQGALIDAIGLNWRVEMWGEGYGLQTLRRLTHAVELGGNHLRSDEELSYTDYRLTLELPTSETSYNPYVGE